MDIGKELLYEVVEKAKKYDELAKFTRGREVRCSFCGKSQSAVKKIITASDVAICDECIELCNEIISEKNTEDESKEDKTL